MRNKPVGIIKIVVSDKRQKLTWQTYSSGLVITYFTLNLKVAIKSYFCMHIIFHISNFRVNKKIHNIYADLNRIARSRFIHSLPRVVWSDDPSSILFIYIYMTKSNWRWIQIRIINSQLSKCFNWRLTKTEEDFQCFLYWDIS